jgi:hypothetical protein
LCRAESPVEAKYIQELLKDQNIRLMNVAQHDAYCQKYRFLSEVTVPAGLLSGVG